MNLECKFRLIAVLFTALYSCLQLLQVCKSTSVQEKYGKAGVFATVLSRSFSPRRGSLRHQETMNHSISVAEGRAEEDKEKKTNKQSLEEV